MMQEIFKELNRIKDEIVIVKRNQEHNDFVEQILQKIEELSVFFESFTNINLEKLLGSSPEIDFLNDVVMQAKQSLSSIFEVLKNISFNLSCLDEDFDSTINNLDYIHGELKQVISSLENFPLLEELIGDEQAVIIVGKNGVGKSTLVNDLKRDKFHNLFCIPAQKYLYITNLQPNDILSSIEEVQNLFTSQNLKIDRKFSYAGAKGDSYEVFSKIIDFIMREHQSSKADFRESQNSKLDEINAIYKELFDDIIFETDSFSAELRPRKNVVYNINSLSDGEKSALFYIICSVLAKEKTIFVVDEPETHLNIALCNKLWDLILDRRKDCKFIFISHNSDFISSRFNSRIVWCKEYRSRNNFAIKTIDSTDIGINNQLLIELVGSRKPILFCEGTVDSLDYKLFNILYSDRYLIKPIKGHIDVINAVKAVKKLNNFGDVLGLIDRDFYSQEILDNYKKKGIYHLPVNEIEMILMQEEVVRAVLADAVKGKTFDDVRIALENIIAQNKDKLAANYVKFQIEGEVFRLSNLKNKEDIYLASKTIMRQLQESENIFDKKVCEIEELIQKKDYDQLVKGCNLKGEVLNGMMEAFENQYEKRALLKIAKSQDLQKYLKDMIALP